MRTIDTLMVWRRWRAGETVGDICRAYAMSTAEVMAALHVEGRAHHGR